MAPLVVAITGFDAANQFKEEPRIRRELDVLLARAGKKSVETVANTVFPVSLWNPNAKRQLLYERYGRIAERIKTKWRENKYGVYFDRMISGGPSGNENQLEFALETYLARPGVRRSVLQIGIFDPTRDHSAAARRGFPCLQHVTFAPAKDGLTVNAFYATQYMVERAYGNYVGLCHLARFVAHELEMPLVRFTCFTGIAECKTPKGELTRMMNTIAAVLGPSAKAGD